MSSTNANNDELEQRVIELENRIEELEQQLLDDGANAEPTEKIVPMPDEVQQLDPVGHDYRKGVHAREVISRVPGATEDGATRGDVVEALAKEGFDEPDEEVDRLRRQGDIYNPRRNLIKLV